MENIKFELIYLDMAFYLQETKALPIYDDEKQWYNIRASYLQAR